MEQLQTPWGGRMLARWPLRRSDPLRAWDAADELLMSYLAEHSECLSGGKPLLLNDGFGALAVALAEFQPLSVSDSWISHQATMQNFAANAIDQPVECLDSLAQWPAVSGQKVMKIPKSHALLEDQLHRLRARMTPGEVLVAGAMAKHIHTSTLALFESIIGSTQTSLAKKKARLVFATFDPSLGVAESPYPLRYDLPEYGLSVSNHANVFSREKLDIGTRFFLQHLPQKTEASRIVDLGCGNGLLGLMAARAHPHASVLFVDESYMAVDSARINAQQMDDVAGRCEFRVGHCLDEVESQSADLVLNNPPFHQQHAVGDQVAWQMFRQSLRVLRPGGELHVVGNRHLAYHVKLKRLFGNCTAVASNQKFVILKSVKHPGVKNDQK